ncbi:hypothetical protein Tco_1034177, partial [Tanacetum coccineum]
DMKEFRAPKNQDSRNREITRWTVPVEETTLNALVLQVLQTKTLSQMNDKYKSGEGYHVVPLPYTGNFMPPKPDLVLADKDEYVFNWISDSEDENETEFKTKQRKPSFAKGNPQLELQEKGVIDIRCSRHMTGNMSYLFDYEEINGGYVTFGGNPKGGKITGKGKIKTGKLDFKDVYFVKELKFNLFNVSQMCGKKNSVLFTNTECVVLSSNFKLTDENHVLLKVPRKDNMYRSGPEWLFDIDTLTISMNYKPVVAGNQSNGNAGTKACDDASKARVEKIPRKDYILAYHFGSRFHNSSCSKDSPDAGFKPLGEEEKKDAKDLENKDSEVPSK